MYHDQALQVEDVGPIKSIFNSNPDDLSKRSEPYFRMTRTIGDGNPFAIGDCYKFGHHHKTAIEASDCYRDYLKRNGLQDGTERGTMYEAWGS